MTHEREDSVIQSERKTHLPFLVDMSPLKAGGGCQLALSFLSAVRSENQSSQLLFLIPDSGPLKDADQHFPELTFATAPTSSPVKRLIFERRELPRLIHQFGIERIYTFFGPGLPHPVGVTSVVSVAYPIICYPESEYWHFVDRRTRLRQLIVNAARVRRIRSADVVVAETEVMRARLARVLRVDRARIVVEPPAPSHFLKMVDRSPQVPQDTPELLVLSGAAPHKNVWRIPEINRELRRLGSPVRWLLSMTQETFESHLKADGRVAYSAHPGDFTFLGTIAPMQIQDAYARAQALVSLSDLESFSNNYLEAWRSGTPLIASDRDFARAVCGDSAVYVEPHSPAEAAKTIADFLNSPQARQQCLDNGLRLVAQMPTTSERVASLLMLIRGS